MRRKLTQFWNGLMLNCEDATRLSFDVPKQLELTFAERLQLSMHRSLCIWCQRYYKHTKFLSEAMKSHQQKSAEGDFTDIELSDETKDKLKLSLRDSSK
jgi:hypothetical protein